jgi:hypothetical protein
MLPDLESFAREWIRSWNEHDLDAILAHYSEDVEVTTPMIQTLLGIGSGTLKGKKPVGDYWGEALDKVPDLHFELVEATQSVDSIALYYRSVLGRMAIEVMFFNAAGKIRRVIAHYN